MNERFDTTDDHRKASVDVNCKADTLVRQTYVVPKRNVVRLRKMSYEQGVSVNELVRRAIDAYVAHNGTLGQAAEHAAAEAVFAETHRQFRAVARRMDASLAEAARHERALRDPALQERIRRETELWCEKHSQRASQIFAFLAPHTSND